MKIKPFAKPAPVRTIGAVWRKTTTRGKAIEAVIAAIRAAMKEDSKR
jgi:DNA-binding transcriptional LysR family regulator